MRGFQKASTSVALELQSEELESLILFEISQEMWSTKLSFSCIGVMLLLHVADATNATTAGTVVLRRGKRYLDFLATSRMFFRINCKNNIIPKPIIWAHGYGYRANFPIEADRKTRPFRRDTYELLGELMDRHGFDGQACILKAFCTAHVPLDGHAEHGMLFKLLRQIFTLESHEKRHMPYLRLENCAQILHSHCPLSFNSISPYTDDV